ncbi:MAG: NAD-dependent epimerase/dehydratase family protein [Pseudomonadota bacterium]
MTVLVTGAGGFLGGRVVRRLVADGTPVRGLDVAYPTPLPDAVDCRTGSVLDRDAVTEAMQGVETIIHAAAIAGLWAPGRFDHQRVNAAGTCRVLGAARKVGARIVHVSSYVTLIGRAHDENRVLDETVEIPPTQLLGQYPLSKRQAELFVEAGAANGIDAVMVMPAAPIGAGDVSLTPPARMMVDLAMGKVPALLDCVLNLVDAEAVVDAILAARTKGVAGERYLLSGHDIAMRDLAGMIAERTGVPAPKRTVPTGVALAAARGEAVLARLTRRPPTAPLTGVRIAARRCKFDSAKARETLGFAPRSLEDCLDEAFKDFRVRGLIAQNPV